MRKIAEIIYFIVISIPVFCIVYVTAITLQFIFNLWKKIQ